MTDNDLADLTRSFKQLCEEAVQAAQEDCARVMADEAKRGIDERVLDKIEARYYAVAADTTDKMARLAGSEAPPAWDTLERGLVELRDALSEDLSRFFRDEARWAPSEARQELAKWFFKAVHGATTAIVDDLRHGRMCVQPT